ncbi:hypothetical protein NDU88_000702 [Pleurodeles waltl]|uniref:Uncharacterized protein n=1 Tax=Pleurodeles waltl TaxID=8319 RepID=A0AAV7LAN4_PLEWA|nr:hypothetical protein NDU88_000702 [Pleurodeles waltl]
MPASCSRKAVPPVRSAPFAPPQQDCRLSSAVRGEMRARVSPLCALCAQADTEAAAVHQRDSARPSIMGGTVGVPPVTVEKLLNPLPDQDLELWHLRRKLIDIEDQSRSGNLCFFDFPKHAEELDTCGFLRDLLPTLTGLSLSPPLLIQRYHLLGPSHVVMSGRAWRLIACLLRYEQVQQLLDVTHTKGPYDFEDHEILITVEFSWKTNRKRKTFVALWPHLRKFNIKFGLFAPACMWIMKDGKSKDFFDPGNCGGLLDQGMDTDPVESSTVALPADAFPLLTKDCGPWEPSQRQPASPLKQIMEWQGRGNLGGDQAHTGTRV